MKSSIQKLFNIFKLEIENNYDNRAVIGGLDRFLDTWESLARTEQVPEDLIQVIDSNLRNYSRLSPGSRSDVLEGLWKRIQSETSIEQSLDLSKKQLLKDQQKVKPQPIKHRDSSQDHLPIEENVRLQESQERSSKPVTPHEPFAALDAPVTVIQGIGSKHSQTLERLGICTLRDFLFFTPRRYDDYSQLKPINHLKDGDEVTIIGTLEHLSQRKSKDSKTHLVEAIISDGTGALRVTWFNQPWRTRRLQIGAQYALAGKIDKYLGRLTINNPEPDVIEQQMLSSNRIVPVYPSTEHITQRWLRKLMNEVVSYWAPRIQDYLPADILQSAGLMDLSTAILQVHYPDSFDKLNQARYRLAFDEIFLLQIGVQQQKLAWQIKDARIYKSSENRIENLINRLPFTLTSAQTRALEDIRSDLSKGQPMNRLLQGDVGSGKTIIAAIAITMIAEHGSQAALMAPTSILAEQHYQNIKEFLCQKHPNSNKAKQDNEENDSSVILEENEVKLLIGATPETQKSTIRDGLSNGDIKLIIGTHALIEPNIEFKDLQLIIIDEQHRFGVQQRGKLRNKGNNPHLLVMTATPIPRSLALTLYGDLDLSVIDEVPAGRKEIKTYILPPVQRERAYNLIRKQINNNKQAFIIYPLVEESENNETKAAVEEYEHLKMEIFPQHKLGLLYGRMKQEEKDEIMAAFRAHQFDILVSTSVIEVGVDIPNATVMLIEGANHFGLAQLHQLRGRVGRGFDLSYCILIPDHADEIENERLLVMTTTSNGFELAERDLQQRGPGQFFGTLQSGYLKLRFSNLTDIHLIENARRNALILIETDANLTKPEHHALSAELAKFWTNIEGEFS